MKKMIRFLASLKLAVVVILGIGIIVCVGTLIESRFDARTARLLVYDSFWMYGILSILIVNLMAVIVDRYPWKSRHLAFILAHVGIIIIIAGGWFTAKYGIDGTMRLAPGERSNQVVLPETVLTLYKSSDGEQFEKIWEEPFEAVTAGFSKDRPFKIALKDLTLNMTEVIPFGIPRMQVEASSFTQSGAGLRFFLSNGRVTFSDWLVQRTVFEKVESQAGPLLLTMGGLWERNALLNEIRLVPRSEGVEYAFYDKGNEKPAKQGFAKEGEILKTSWMDLEFRVMRYFPKATVRWDMQSLERPTPNSTSAIKVQHQGVESWLVNNDYLKIFTDRAVYLLSYMRRRIELPIYVELLNFDKTNYPGSARAMAYKSHVKYGSNNDTETLETVIAMNEPLQTAGFYLYQAGFEETPAGQIKASVLSVNQDPGRILKYLGSLIMCLGIVMLFYFKKIKK